MCMHASFELWIHLISMLGGLYFTGRELKFPAIVHAGLKSPENHHNIMILGKYRAHFHAESCTCTCYEVLQDRCRIVCPVLQLYRNFTSGNPSFLPVFVGRSMVKWQAYVWHVLQKGIVAGDVQGAPGSKDNLMFLTETRGKESVGAQAPPPPPPLHKMSIKY